MATTEEERDSLDFAVAAYHEDGDWQVEEIVHALTDDVETLATVLRRFPADGGALGMISVADDFAVLVRAPGGVHGAEVRLLLSDVTAAEVWPLARSILDRLGLPGPDEDDAPEPAGDLDLLHDLGVDARDLGNLLDDELYPDELLSALATRLGFGDLFDRVVGFVD